MRATVAAALIAGAWGLDSKLAALPAIRDEVIAAVNSANAGWVAGVNSKFVNMTLGQAARMMGTRKNRGLLPRAAEIDIDVSALPVNYNVSSAAPQCASVINHIRDQSDCGCCWAFGSTESFNDRLCMATNKTTLMSPQDTCSCCDGNFGCSGSSGCDGGFTEDAWNYFTQHGVVTGGDNPSAGSGSSCFPYQLEQCDHHEGGPYPQCPNVCSGGECNTPACPAEQGKGCSESKYTVPWAKDKHFAKSGYSVSSNAAAIQKEIYAKGSVAAAFTVYEDFLTYTSGVYTHVSGSELGGHAVKIVGWGVEGSSPYWLVANSWNTYWGNGGFFKIARGTDECGIEDDIVAGDV